MTERYISVYAEPLQSKRSIEPRKIMPGHNLSSPTRLDMLVSPDIQLSDLPHISIVYEFKRSQQPPTPRRKLTSEELQEKLQQDRRNTIRQGRRSKIKDPLKERNRKRNT